MFNPNTRNSFQSSGGKLTSPGALSGSAPTRIERLAHVVSTLGLGVQPDPDDGNGLLISIDDEVRFQLIAPPRSSAIMLVARVFTGSPEEIAQMAPSLLHANFTCQRLALDNPLGLPLEEDQSDLQWLPVMGLDLEKLTVVLSLQIPAVRLDDVDFADFLDGLMETISHDADVLVEQFKALTLAAA